MAGDASRTNGAKGGRPRNPNGRLTQQAYDARKRARQSLQEQCQAEQEELFTRLRYLAYDPLVPPNVCMSAISLLIDRGWGKAVQPNELGGSVTMIVSTGVPEPDPDSDDYVPMSPGGYDADTTAATRQPKYPLIQHSDDFPARP